MFLRMELATLQALALEITQERTVDAVLHKIVTGLAQQPGVALARLWLRGPGDLCSTCPMRGPCPDQTTCLHLMASAGTPVHAGSDAWSRLDGAFRRFPLHVLKIGSIGATGVPILLPDIAQQPAWIAHPEWAQHEGIRAFAGQPLIFRREILGVLALFSRQALDQPAFAWLRMFADHAAVAIANSRAFAEIDRLREQLRLENDYLREEVQRELAFGAIVGSSPALTTVLEQIALVAPTDANVMILGASGTGKELIARAIHARSQRAAKPLVKVNCAAIPRELFESEFFGHGRGAFTGAVRDRAGRFQLADGGTLFLDEIGDIPLELQSKLLRVLQDGTFERLGEERTRQVNVRIVAATNRDLRRAVETGHFRQDLFFRLNVFPMEVPRLTERREDIPLLVRHFLQQARQQGRCGPLQLSDQQMALLQRYDWPGNVRELHNVLERAIILSQGGTQPLHLERLLPADDRPAGADRMSAAPHSAPAFLTQVEWVQRERDNLLAALNAANGKIYGPGGAAELLGMKATTLASRLQAMGIKKVRG